MSTSTPTVAILLASFRGGRYISAQLDSLARQDYRAWRLVVSDDGSDDDTRVRVRDFAAAHPGRDVTLIDGPGAGATQNFLSLIQAVEPGEALAFCDQDDVWHADRLSRGIDALARHRGDRGLLHVTRTTICDEALQPLRPAPLYRRPPGFANALVQACTPGNTTLVDPVGAALMRRTAPAAARAAVVSHDWWTYQIIAGAGGRVVRDPAQTVLYRQHAGNVMGRNDTAAAMLARLTRLTGGDYASWLRANIAALNGVRDELTVQNVELLDRFAYALDLPGPRAAAQLIAMGIHRQTSAGTLALMAAAAGGRLRRKNR